MLIVTHEVGFAREVSSRTVFLHQGRIEEEGPPKDVFGNPRSDRSACANSSPATSNAPRTGEPAPFLGSLPQERFATSVAPRCVGGTSASEFTLPP